MLATIFRVLFFLMFAGSGVMHFVNPAFFVPLMPEFVPFKVELIYLSGAVEVITAVMLFIPKTKRLAAGLVFLMLLAFTPLHVLDLFKDEPVVGSQLAAIIRLVLQALLLAAAAYLFRRPTTSTETTSTQTR